MYFKKCSKFSMGPERMVPFHFHSPYISIVQQTQHLIYTLQQKRVLGRSWENISNKSNWLKWSFYVWVEIADFFSCMSDNNSKFLYITVWKGDLSLFRKDLTLELMKFVVSQPFEMKLKARSTLAGIKCFKVKKPFILLLYPCHTLPKKPLSFQKMFNDHYH